MVYMYSIMEIGRQRKLLRGITKDDWGQIGTTRGQLATVGNTLKQAGDNRGTVGGKRRQSETNNDN